MAYTIRKRESYRWTVEHVIEVRQGKPDAMVFDAEFKALGQARVNELMTRARSLAIQDPEFADAILVDIHELTDEGGKVYHLADLQELAERFPGILGSIGSAWMLSVQGIARKN